MRSFEWFVAWRYLFSRRRALVSVITFISFLGVAIGVAALIIVIGVMDGADQVLFGRIEQLYPHVRIASANGPGGTLDPALLTRLREDPHVARAEPVMDKKTFIQVPGRTDSKDQLVQLIGIDRIGKGSIYQLSDELKEQAIQVPDGQILLGYALGWNLGAIPGTEVSVTSTQPVSTALGPRFKTLPNMKVAYWFNTGFADFDVVTAFVSRATFEKLYRGGSGGDYIHVKLKDPFRANAFKASLNLGPQWRVTTWSEENREFFGALNLEKLGMFLVLLLVILVAALNIVGTLILMVMEKTREIGILRALGASEGKVARIFLFDGVMIGLVGTVVGVVLGVGVCLLIPLIDIGMPDAVYNFNTLPVRVKWTTVGLIVVSAMAICTLMALFPARKAAQLDPVEALRHD